MAYIFNTKQEVVEYLSQMEFTFGDDYSHYIVPKHMYTTRFNIFYKGTNCGFVENENFNDVSSDLWVINIPTEKRAFLEAEQPGIYEAIFTEPTNADGDIDKKYYIDPKAFNRVIIKDSKNTPYKLSASGPGSYFGLKFANDFVKIDDTEIDKDTTQVTINIDSKALASKLRYDLAELSGNFSVTDPGAITVKNVPAYPAIIVARSKDKRPNWESLDEIEVKRAEVATRAESLDNVTLDKFITNDNFTTAFAEIIENSSKQGFYFAYDLEHDNRPYIGANDYIINLVGDVSGSARAQDFNNIDIECRLRDRQAFIDSLKPCPIELMGGVLDDRLVANKGVIIPIDGNHVFGDHYDDSVPLTIGDYTKFHLEFDNNEIMAKTNESNPAGIRSGALFLQSDGGLVSIGSRARTNLHVNGNITILNELDDPGNTEPSEGNLTVAGASNLLGNTSVGSVTRNSDLTVYGNTNLNGLNVSTDDSGDIIFNIAPNRKYKFNIDNATALSISNDSDGIASIAYVDEAIARLVNSAPETLDTLGELATALHDSNNLVNSFMEEVGNRYSVVDHNHDSTYLKLTGGTLTGQLTTNADENEVFQIKDIDGGAYRDIVAYNNATSTRLGSIRFNAGNADGSNSITIGISDGINSAPSGLTVIRTIGDGVNAGKISIKGVTPDVDDNSTCLATTAYVKSNLNNYYTKTDIDTAFETFNPTGNYAPISHTHVSADINSMDGYEKATSASAIDTTDSLNIAIGKLEKAIEGKQPIGSYAYSTHGHASSSINFMTGYSKAGVASAISTNDSLNTAIGKLERALDDKQASGSYAATSHNQASNTINVMTGYTKAASASAIAATDSLNTAIGKLEKALDGKQASGSYLLTTETAADSSKLGGTSASSYAKLNSPTFTGTPSAVTAASTVNTTQLATTEFVQNRLITPVVKVVALSGDSSMTINPANGSLFTLKPVRNCSITIDNLPSIYNSCGGVITLFITKTSYVISWNSKIKWMSGYAPDTLNEGYSMITFVTSDGGETYYANVLTQE